MNKIFILGLLLVGCGQETRQQKVECCEPTIITQPPTSPLEPRVEPKPKTPECETAPQNPQNNIDININIDGSRQGTETTNRTDSKGCKSEYRFIRGSFTRYHRCHNKKVCESFGHYEVVQGIRQLTYDHNLCDDTRKEVIQF